MYKTRIYEDNSMYKPFYKLQNVKQRCKKLLQNAQYSLIMIYTIYQKKYMKNKTTAILLAFFLGGIGIHKFYLSRP